MEGPREMVFFSGQAEDLVTRRLWGGTPRLCLVTTGNENHDLRSIYDW